MLQNKLWDVKERTHCSQRVGHVVPGVVVYLDLCRRRSGWVRCDHNGLKRLPEAPLICWRPISPLWFLRNSALGCKWGNWHHSSIYLSILCFPFLSFHFPHHLMEPINILFGFLKNIKIEMQSTASLGLGQFHHILFPFSINVQFTLLSLIVIEFCDPFNILSKFSL